MKLKFPKLNEKYNILGSIYKIIKIAKSGDVELLNLEDNLTYPGHINTYFTHLMRNQMKKAR